MELEGIYLKVKTESQISRHQLPESRAYLKKQKDAFAWANAKGVSPMSKFFSDDIELLVSESGVKQEDVKSGSYEEHWYDPAELLDSANALIDTAESVAKKKPTARYLVDFFRELAKQSSTAMTSEAEVHLCVTPGW